MNDRSHTKARKQEPSDVGSPGVVIYGYDGLPMHPVDPPSPNHVPGPEEPEVFLTCAPGAHVKVGTQAVCHSLIGQQLFVGPDNN
ncbi:hypothetical protein Tco_0671581 [Tanacetum coccineum]